MMRARTLLALVVVSLFAVAAFAQSSEEFGRASGGSLELITKAPHQFSGSLSLSHSLGGFRGQSYDGSAGGAIVNDRVWFFAAATVLPRVQFSTQQMNAVDTRATAQPVDWSNATATFRRNDASTPTSAPSSFLSLRSTTMLSDHMVFDVSVSRSNATRSMLNTQ